MAEQMDKMEEMGVLAKPEDVGVILTFVVPSLHVPKPEKGEFQWTQQLSKQFNIAKEALLKINTIHLPRPTDSLEIYSDYSEEHKAVGGRMLIKRKDEDGNVNQLLGGHFSFK